MEAANKHLKADVENGQYVLYLVKVDDKQVVLYKSYDLSGFLHNAERIKEAHGLELLYSEGI